MKKVRNNEPLEAILFDVYGTLVEIRDKRAPFRQLLRIGEQQGRRCSEADATVLMSSPLGLRTAAARLGIDLNASDLARLESDLHAEIASIHLYPDTDATLRQLSARGYKLGLCSNLALDYAEPVLSLLPFRVDATIWSFQVGAIKPNPAIYAQACGALACAPARVLMVGDTLAADVNGPRACGMRGLLVDRHQRHDVADSINSLSALLDLIRE